MFSCEFREVSKNTFFYRTPLGDCFCHYEKTEPSLQSTFLIKLYQPEENPTVVQILEKDVQCFLYLIVCILNSEREKLFIF